MHRSPVTRPPASILIVDDDQGLSCLLQKTLEREGFGVAVAGSGAAALEWLARNKADLLLVDLRLPDIEGKHLVDQLEEAGRAVPFVVITGRGDERVAVEMMKRGALDYLVKGAPFLDLVASSVRRALEKLETNRRLAVAEAAMRIREGQFHSFIQQAPAIMAMFDQQMNYLAASRRWLDAYGGGRVDLAGLNHYDVCPDVPDRWKESHRKGLLGGKLECEEDLWLREDGSRFWLRWGIEPWRDARGEIGGIIIITEDITARKTAEEAFRRRAEELAAILDAVPMPVFIAHDPECRHITGNRAGDELLRASRGAEVSLSAPEHLKPRHFKAVKDGRELTDAELPAQRAARGFPVRDFSCGLVFDDGKTMDIVAYAEPLRDAEGRPRGSVAALMDITLRKRLELEIVEISEEEKRALGRDLHDGLGQRLTSLEMMSYVLAEDAKGVSPELAKQAERVNSELRETVMQARLISHNLALVPMNGDGLALGLERLAGGLSRIPGVNCRFICHEPVHVRNGTAATHLLRIAQEAANNALKHGGASEIVITLAETGGRLELAVHNNGGPMPAGDSGLETGGMGLHLMRYRAEMIGATLEITSKKGEGVLVHCCLKQMT